MSMPAFQFALPARVVFGRGEAAQAPGELLAMGRSGVVVHGADAGRADWLVRALREGGARLHMVACGAEPTLPMLMAGCQPRTDIAAQPADFGPDAGGSAAWIRQSFE